MDAIDVKRELLKISGTLETIASELRELVYTDFTTVQVKQALQKGKEAQLEGEFVAKITQQLLDKFGEGE